MPIFAIGDTTSKPGEIAYGWFDAVALPTGNVDRLPIIIAQGKDADGPVFWITTGIHGGEHTGPIVIQRFITQQLVKTLRGTLIAIPALNPAGMRIKQRSPYYLEDDPNRLFPRPGIERSKKEEKPKSSLEIAYQHLYDAIKATKPIGLIDLHNAWYGSIPFIFRDPVLYHKRERRRPTRQQAQVLQDKTGKMIDAVGFTVVNEFSADSYISKNLHRSVSGSILNKAGIPAITIELGSWMHVDEGIVEACMAGLRNALRWAGMLPDGQYEAISGIPIVRPPYPVRRQISPYAPQAGIVHHLVRPGQTIKKGQPLVRMTNIFGQPLGEDDGLLRSKYEGFVLGWFHGIVRYQGEPIMGLAIRDESSLLVPYPES